MTKATLNKIGDFSNDFTMIPNKLLNLNITYASKILLVLLLSKPNNWIIFNHNIQETLDMSENMLSKCWKELIKSGFIEKSQIRKPNGDFYGSEIKLYINRIMGPHFYGAHENGNPLNSAQSNTNTEQYLLNNKTDINNIKINKKADQAGDTPDPINLVDKKVEELISYYNTFFNTQKVASRETITNMIKVLKNNTIDDCKLVIKFICENKWNVEEGFNTLSTIFKPTKFHEKLERANMKKEDVKKIEYTDTDRRMLIPDWLNKQYPQDKYDCFLIKKSNDQGLIQFRDRTNSDIIIIKETYWNDVLARKEALDKARGIKKAEELPF